MFNRTASRATLLTGVSLAALLVGALTPAEARDLRQTGAPVINVTAQQMATQQQAAGIAQQSRSALIRATQSMQAVQALQAAARAAAQARQSSLTSPVNVPNGLAVGGLEPDSRLASTGVANPVTTWVGARTPTQTVSGDQTIVNVQQTSAQAILNWTSFNVGARTTLNFDQQGNSSWVALNRVTAGTAPSQILGNIKADGQIYVINRNGIIFGGSAQVNVGTLVASALPINEALLNAGTLFSNADTQFTFSAYSQPGGSSGPTDAFQPDATTQATQNSKVIVEQGAVIATTPSPVHSGGRVILVGPQVENHGSIRTPDGQTILAAGQQVALLPHASSDPKLRGFDVFVGSVLAPVADIAAPDLNNSAHVSSLVTGIATNSGLIEAERGNITIAGAAVNQLGATLSTTSASLNGRIDLQARYNAVGDSQARAFRPTVTGSVTLGVDSLMWIRPELDSSERVAGTSLALPSEVNIAGRIIHLDERARILAPSAQVTIDAGQYRSDGGSGLLPNEGQIYVSAGAEINVAGSTDITAQVSQNIIAVQLLGAQLADSPLQRSGSLRGKTIYVDIRQTGTYADGTTWIGTPLADVSGYANLIQRSVGELTTGGGSIKLQAGQAVVLQQGSVLDVSGGTINYQGGMVSTTRLIGADGRVYDIGKATPDRSYVGIAGGFSVSHARWGITETFTSPWSKRYEPGYIQGGPGGSISIQAPAAALDGTMQGEVAAGERQRSAQPGASSFSFVAQTFGSSGEFPTPNVTQDVIFQSNVTRQPLPAFNPNELSLDDSRPIYFSPDIVGEDGFGKVSITTANGDIRILSALEGRAKGSISLTAKNIDIAADVTLAGGALNFKTVTLNPSQELPGGVFAEAGDIAGRGALTLQANATLSTAGLIVDNRGATGTPLVLDGGSVSLNAFHLDLGTGSVIDVSGGVAMAANGKQTSGNAGSIALAGGDNRVNPAVTRELSLGAELKGYALGKGGSLSLSLPRLIQIGGAAANADTLHLSPDFFNRGGFASFSLSGIKIDIAAGTIIDPVVQSYATAFAESGSSLTPTLLPAEARSPVSLAFSAVGVPDGAGGQAIRGDVVLHEGALIRLAPTSRGTGQVRINDAGSANTAAILGSIIVPGGTIAINGGLKALGNGIDVVLGKDSLLSVKGAAVIVPDARGWRRGSVLDGGTINLEGNILAEAGAVLDVSGIGDVLDAAGAGLSHASDPIRIDSNGGSINLSGPRYMAATMLGTAGGPTAHAGSLSILVPNLLVTQSLASEISHEHGTAALGSEVLKDGAPIGNYFAIDMFSAGGFESLALGSVEFSGPVRIAAARSVTIGGSEIGADAAVSITAPYVAIGTAYAAETGAGGQLPTPSFGAGSLDVSARLIDVGNVGMRTVGKLHLTADDIRGYGRLAVQGDITLTAGQIYPTTVATFTILALDHGGTAGSVTILAGQARALPLSAGGTLNIFASSIHQNGVLRAPFGMINLGSATAQENVPATTTLTLGTGSITSVSAIDPVTGQALVLPYGTEPNGTSWIDPSGHDITSGGAAQKAINLSGQTIDIGSGATLDLRGGGDLFAYNWVKGLGGSKDILASSSAFAILPGYQSDFAPQASFINSATSAEPGWSNPSLCVGDRVWLAASDKLPAGYYTLLPARYALLPGAFLVTAKGSAPNAGVSLSQPDGSSIVSGFRGNALVNSQDALPTLFEVASSDVMRARAQYDVYSANTALREGALAHDAAVPRLPVDAGQLVLVATRTMDIRGQALMGAPAGGLGGLVDIASASDIVVNNTGSGSASGTLYLNASGLSTFGAESLLIGGTRSITTAGTTVNVTTANVTVANDASHVLFGPEIILTSIDNLTIQSGAAIEQRGTLSSPAETLRIGSVALPGSGNGALLRVSSDPSAPIARFGVLPGVSGRLAVGAGSAIAGNNIILDSTNLTTFDPTAQLAGRAVTLGGGQISIQLTDPGPLQPGVGLVLPNAVLANLQSSIGALSLLSYSSIDLYGTGTVGSVDASGRPSLESLALHAASIRGFNANGRAVTLNARHVLIDNSPNARPVAAVAGVNSTPSGTLLFNTETIEIGANSINVAGYNDLNMVATGGLVLTGTGGLSTAGNLNVTAPVITAGLAAKQGLAAQDALTVHGSATQPSVTGGVGAALTLTAARVDMNGNIRLPSGVIALRATSQNVTVGGTLDASGIAQRFYDQIKYTSGGQVALTADNGSVVLAAGSVVSVAAPSVAGDAGSLTVSATKGTFAALGTLSGEAGAGGKSGVFVLDVGSAPSLAAVNAALDAGHFNEARAMRVRTGNVLVDGHAKARNFLLAADSGAITVTGTIDASGVTGGQIGLYGYNGVKLASGAVLTVAANQLDAAGKGGLVDIETGQARQIGTVMVPGVGWIDLQTGSTIDLSVAGGPGGTLHLRAPQITGVDGAGNPIPATVGTVAGGSDVAIKPLNGTIRNASSVVVEGVQVFDLTAGGGTITQAVQDNINANGQAFTANTAAITSRLLGGSPNAGLGTKFHARPGEELVSRAVLPVTLSTAGGTLNLPAGAAISFPSGVPSGDIVTFSSSGVYTDAAGVRRPFSAGTPVTIAANGTVTLDSAGTMNFVSGTAAINLTLHGVVTSVAGGPGKSTSFSPVGNGIGITINPGGGTLALPANATIAFPNALIVGDAITLPSGTLTIPTGGSAVRTIAPGTTVTFGLVLVPFALPPGDRLDSTTGNSMNIGTGGVGATTLVLANGQTVAPPANSVQTIPLGAGSNSGATFAGDSFSVNSGSTGSTSFTATSAGKIVSTSGAVLKTFAAGEQVAYQTSFANARFVLNTAGTLSYSTGSANATVTYRSTTGNTTTLVLPVPGTGVQYQSFNGTITSLSSTTTVNGTFTLQGPSPLNQTFRTSQTLPAGTVITSLSSGASFKKDTTAGNLSVSATSSALALNLAAGTYTATGSVSLTPSGTDITLPNLAAAGQPATVWNLSGYRYGPGVDPAIAGSGEPGVLTLRSAGNLIFRGSLSDGFLPSSNTLLAAGSDSWSYRLVAGADLGGAEFRQVLPLSSLADGVGSVQLGVPNAATSGTTTALAKNGSDQLIRTGTGDIDIAAGRDVQLLSQFATIYTAGSKVTPGGATASTLNPGGSLTIGANLPLLFPNGTSGGAITATVDGSILINNPASGLALPAGTVYIFAYGFSSSTSAAVRPSALQTEVSVSKLGAIVIVPGAGGTIGGFAAGAKIYLTTSADEGALIASGPGIAYQADGSGNFIPIPFNAGEPLPFLQGGSTTNPNNISSYIVLTNGGSLTETATRTVGLALPPGVFTLTRPGEASAFSFTALPPGSTLRALDPGGGSLTVVTSAQGMPKFFATLAFAANTPMILPANSTVTLSTGGALSLSGGSATAVAVPAAGAGASYLFDTPSLGSDGLAFTVAPSAFSTPQYSTRGGNITIAAGRDIIHLTTNGVDDSSQQLPVNWLYRRSSAENGVFARGYFGDMASTTWWIDYSNFYEGIGTLGGGNLNMTAGRDVKNVDGVVPTNAWMPYQTVRADGSVDALAANQPLFEYGGGNLVVTAGRDINAGVYYVEKGQGRLSASGSITTNATRSALADAATTYSQNPVDWLPTTLFLGKGSFDLTARGDVLLGSVANPFLLPQGLLNGTWERAYFSTYDAADTVAVSSLTGDVTLKGDTVDNNGITDLAGPGTLGAWFSNVLATPANQSVGSPTVSKVRPWLKLTEQNIPRPLIVGPTGVTAPGQGDGSSSGTLGYVYRGQIGLRPPSLKVTAFTQDINVIGTLTLAPSPTGTVDLAAAGSIDGLQKTGALFDGTGIYGVGTINLSDADPDAIPGIRSPMKLVYSTASVPLLTHLTAVASPLASVASFNELFAETGATKGLEATRSRQQALHDKDLLRQGDLDPIHIYAGTGDISGLQIYSAKSAQIIAGNDITDVGLYLQNLRASDVSQVIAGRDIIPFNEKSKMRLALGVELAGAPGDISIGGPGTLEVLAGRNLDLGGAPANPNNANQFGLDGVGLGIVSIGNGRNPYLPTDRGADIIAAAGLGPAFGTGESLRNLDVAAFVAAFIDPATAGAAASRYLPYLADLMHAPDASSAWQSFGGLSRSQQQNLALELFYLVLRDAGRDHNDPNALNGTRNYEAGFRAIETLFPGNKWKGDISLTSREIKTVQGGDINLLVPGGQLVVGYDLGNKQPLDQGILTLSGGNISIFASDSVTVGTSRIFTFEGGNEIIWSSGGNIAAGSASKTLVSAPPARFLIDPVSGASTLDPSGLATGGGIGVLQTVKDALPGNVDLIAPAGFVDAGDAGIRSSGNVNISAVLVLNAFNIQAQGTTTGVPQMVAPNVSGLAAAGNVTAASQQAGVPAHTGSTDRPSVIIVEVLGYGGADGSEPSQDNDQRRKNEDRQSFDGRGADPEYNSRSAVQITGYGMSTESEAQMLTPEERRKLHGTR